MFHLIFDKMVSTKNAEIWGPGVGSPLPEGQDRGSRLTPSLRSPLTTKPAEDRRRCLDPGPGFKHAAQANRVCSPGGFWGEGKHPVWPRQACAQHRVSRFIPEEAHGRTSCHAFHCSTTQKFSAQILTDTCWEGRRERVT